MVALQHVNFHTWHRRPVFEREEFDLLLRRWLPDALGGLGIICPVWEVMPTHVHLILTEFIDLPLPTMLKHIKGATSRAFFVTFPDMRADLGGGHLWRKGYFSVAITTHQQFLATAAYIRANRTTSRLLPPVPLVPSTEDRV